MNKQTSSTPADTSLTWYRQLYVAQEVYQTPASDVIVSHVSDKDGMPHKPRCHSVKIAKKPLTLTRLPTSSGRFTCMLTSLRVSSFRVNIRLRLVFFFFFNQRMSRDGAVRAPRFEGEDVSPTTERELRGWYSTGLAAEIFAVCGVGLENPQTLNGSLTD
jgi:hypothetical protein